jgi:HSP20 family molecular chaperone IbpA
MYKTKSIFDDVDSAFREFDWLFKEPLNPFYVKRDKPESKYDEENNSLSVSLPGIGKENIKVYSPDPERLVIEWSASKKDTPEKLTYRVERHNDAKAEYVDGILKISFTPEKKSEKVEIKIK